MNHTEQKTENYKNIISRLNALLIDEKDEIAAMATISCELFHGLSYVSWAGWYRQVVPNMLVIGPYQGQHGCLRIPFQKGICGQAARKQKTICIDDVRKEVDHIACSSTTLSEIVVPLIDSLGHLKGVLDLDSDLLGAFDEVDQMNLEKIVRLGPFSR